MNTAFDVGSALKTALPWLFQNREKTIYYVLPFWRKPERHMPLDMAAVNARFLFPAKVKSPPPWKNVEERTDWLNVCLALKKPYAVGLTFFAYSLCVDHTIQYIVNVSVIKDILAAANEGLSIQKCNFQADKIRCIVYLSNRDGGLGRPNGDSVEQTEYEKCNRSWPPQTSFVRPPRHVYGLAKQRITDTHSSEILLALPLVQDGNVSMHI